MKIRITQQDIDNGRKGDFVGCAIAVALKREFAYVSVSGWICIGEKYYLGQDEVLDWIADFDNRDKPVKPITIELVQTCVPEKYRPKFFVHTLRRGDTRKARRTPAPPDLQVCGIARIAD